MSTPVLEADTGWREITVPLQLPAYVSRDFRLTFDSARALAITGRRAKQAYLTGGPLGRRSIDVFAEARDLIDLRRSWARM